ncbi:MAG: TrmH family RNA methyltransferase [Flavobacteriales bacterium]
MKQRVNIKLLEKDFRDQALLELENLLTDKRKLRFDKVLNSRTDYMAIVLEDIYNPQNANAVIRSCDCFGIQNVHIIEDRNFHEERNETSKGAEKWLNVHHYNNPDQNKRLECVKTLKKDGYRIVSAMPHKQGVTLDEFDVTKGKFAIVLGNELHGVSKEIEKLSDEYINIPMHGFTESLNLSVAGALCMNHLRLKMEKQLDNWLIEGDDLQNLRLLWVSNSVGNGDYMLKRMYDDYLNQKENNNTIRTK